MPSPLLRILHAGKEALTAGAEIRAAHAQGLCVNCKKNRTAPIPGTATSPATYALLCDGCGGAAATASAQILGGVVEQSLEAGLREMFTTRRGG